MGGVSSVANSRPAASLASVAPRKPRTNYKIEFQGATKEATLNEEVSFTLSIKKPEVKLDVGEEEKEEERDTSTDEETVPDVIVEVEHLTEDTYEEADVTFVLNMEPYKYKVCYTPRVRGRYMVTVNVDRAQVATQEVFVHCPPEVLAKNKPAQVSFNVNIPSRIMVDGDGGIYVQHISDTSKTPEIAHLNKNGKQEGLITSKCRSKQASMFELFDWNPKGIAIDNNKNLYIAHPHTLDKLNPKGELLKSINFEDGEENSAEVVHCLPEGMRFHGDRLYVCNGYNNTVLVFDSDLNLRKSLKTGRENKVLQQPYDIDVDHEGNVYVADVCAHKVFVYNPEGRFIHAIGSHGKKEGQLEKPVSLVVSGQYVYVAEELNHRVSVFKTSGEFVCSFEGDEEQARQMRYPSGIAMDRDGYLYLCDRWDRVLRF